MESQPTKGCHVVAVPYPGRGHINPMMNFCRLLVSRSDSIRVTFVVTEEWLGFLGSPSEPPPPDGVRLAAIPNVIPSEVGRARDFSSFFEAVCTKLEEPFERLLGRLEPPAEAIVADVYLPWAVEVGGRRGIPVHLLCPMSASYFSVLYHFDRLPLADDGHVAVRGTGKVDQQPLAKYIPGHNSLQVADFDSVLTSGKPLKLTLQALSKVRKAQSILFSSFYELEPQVFDALRAHVPCQVYPIGPSIPYMLIQENVVNSNGRSTDYIEWLDSQLKSSVLYVSLGGFLSVSGLQMDEIAKGLSLSKIPFLWVARSDSSRLQEMVGDKGLIVPWCDQLRVLRHPSVGGFLSHCGWNSTLEGVHSGLPMLTYPIFWDQPVDSRLIVDEWKIGLSLKGEVGREGIVGKEKIAEVVTRVMDLDGNEEGKDMQSRAAKLREAACGAIETGGSSFSNLDCFIRDLMKGGGQD